MSDTIFCWPKRLTFESTLQLSTLISLPDFPRVDIFGHSRKKELLFVRKEEKNVENRIFFFFAYFQFFFCYFHYPYAKVRLDTSLFVRRKLWISGSDTIRWGAVLNKYIIITLRSNSNNMWHFFGPFYDPQPNPVWHFPFFSLIFKLA